MPEQPKRFIDNESLQQIRTQINWRNLFQAFDLIRTKNSTENNWWALSPFSNEKTPSFHINDQGWYCHSTGQGGGVIELVQKIIEYRTGQTMNCYEAGRWLIDSGLSENGGNKGEMREFIPHRGERSEKKDKTGKNEGKRENVGEKRRNHPIRQTLIPLLETDHSKIRERGVSIETCEYLGCGYLGTDSKSRLADRIVFQVRGVEENEDGGIKPIILTHIGRAMTDEQAEESGKWRPYAGFFKSLELYNIDHLLLDEKARTQAQKSGHVLIVEGCWDVAKLIEAGIYNTVASFGAHFSEEQVERLRLIKEHLGVNRIRFWYDRDTAGSEGEVKAVAQINETHAFKADQFDWDMAFPSTVRGPVKIPANIEDVCDFTLEQLVWLREKKYI